MTCGPWVSLFTWCCVDTLRFTPNTTVGQFQRTCGKRSWQEVLNFQRKSGARSQKWRKTLCESESVEENVVLLFAYIKKLENHLKVRYHKGLIFPKAGGIVCSTYSWKICYRIQHKWSLVNIFLSLSFFSSPTVVFNFWCLLSLKLLECIVRFVFKGNGHTTLLQNNIDDWLPHLQVLSRLVSPMICLNSC